MPESSGSRSETLQRRGRQVVVVGAQYNDGRKRKSIFGTESACMLG